MGARGHTIAGAHVGLRERGLERRERRRVTSGQADAVKQQVAAHWDRRASHFDEDFGHSIRTAARARGLGPHPRSRPRGAGLPRRARCRLRHRLPQLRAGGPGPSRHRRGLRARDGRRGAAQGGGARRARSGSRRPTPSSSRLRPAASTSSSAATCSGRSRTRRRRSTSGRVLRPGARLVIVDGQFDAGALAGVRPVVPGRATSTRRSATSSHSSAAGRGRRSKHC